MKTRLLRDIEVSEVGMGCMAFSHGYGQIPPEEYSVEAIRNAYREGCTFFDTAEIYSPNLSGIGHNERIVGKALHIRLSTITKTSVKNILDAAEIKPFRIQYYCENRNPDFETKMHQLLLVYKQIELLFDENGELYIPAGEQDVHTVSYDEKPGIQAIATTSPDLKPNKDNGIIKRGL